MDSEIEALAAMQRQNPRSAPPLPAEFSVEAVLDEEASKPGAPVYKDKERIRIRVGTRDVKIRDVTAEDRRTYAAQYVAWKKSNHVDNTLEGYPLAQWAMLPGKATV